MDKQYYVYILASRRNGTLYIGVTSDLIRRVWEHKEGMIAGFTKKYHVKQLVYYEDFNDIHEALAREKKLKKWERNWKIQLVESRNPEWKDLYYSLINTGSPLKACGDDNHAGMTKP